MKAIRAFLVAGLLAGSFASTIGAQSPPPVAERIEIVGATTFPVDTLRGSLSDAVESIEREGVTPATADDAAFFLELFYRRNGYARALVTSTILPGGRLQLKVDEGQPVTLGKIDFVGGRGLPEEKQKEYFLGPTRKRVPRGRAELPYVAADVNAGREALIDYFQSEGYLDVRIDPPSTVLRDGGHVAELKIRIVEGRRYRFGPVTIVGVPAFDESRERISWFRQTFFSKNHDPTPGSRCGGRWTN